MTTIFDALKSKPFAELLGISPSRFSQKLNKSVVNGYQMDFTNDERKKMKEFALFIAESIVHEVEKP